MQPPKTLATLGLLAAVLVIPAAARSITAVRMQPASTRVGLAKVLLEMDDLQVVGDRQLGGTYRIRIPLAPRLNDRGDFVLEADALKRIMYHGGEAFGTGHSRLDGRTHLIRCDFAGGGRVKITVETPDRVLSFKTAYEIFDGSERTRVD